MVTRFEPVRTVFNSTAMHSRSRPAKKPPGRGDPGSSGTASYWQSGRVCPGVGTISEPGPSLADRGLRLFSDVRAGESAVVLLMGLNLFLALVSYYIIKTVREPLILASGGAELKSYAAGGQALVLMGLIPLYSWFSSRVDRARLIRGVLIFFVVCIELFYVAAWIGVPFLGVLFFIWVGIFSLALIAQFWSFANDLYDRGSGERLFPVIAVGASLGSMAGSKIASVLFESGLGAYNMLQISAVLLVLHLLLYAVIEKRMVTQARDESGGGQSKGVLEAGNGFALVFRSRYLLLIGVLMILLNLVNTTGEFILGASVVERANQALPGASGEEIQAYIGGFYGKFFFYMNLLGVLLQAFLVSRIVKYLGMAGVLFALPLVAFGAYGLIALGIGFTVLRWAKTAENATDYSVMNTAKALLWLPTSREEKYKAKQTIDTFFVRSGDVISTGLVVAGTLAAYSMREFAITNLGLIVVWVGLSLVLLRENRRITSNLSRSSD